MAAKTSECVVKALTNGENQNFASTAKLRVFFFFWGGGNFCETV